MNGPHSLRFVRQMGQFSNPFLSRKKQALEIQYNNRTQHWKNKEFEKNLLTFDYSSKSPMKRVYMWGNAEVGALGIPEYIKPSGVKNPIAEMKRPARCARAETKGITDIACGYGFTLWAMKSGKYPLLGSGVNTYGQIGHHRRETKKGPKGPGLNFLIAPVNINIPGTEGMKVINLSAGGGHSVVVMGRKDEKEMGDTLVFTLGNNHYGQCGRTVIEDEDYSRLKYPHEVKFNGLQDGEKVVDVTCGQDHTLFLTNKGRVFACGWGADGQTGLGHYDQQAEPALVKGDIEGQKIVKVACKADNVLALNDQGEVFGWGNSEYGQFECITEEQQICVPTFLPQVKKTSGKIVDVASGGTVCLVLNEEGDVFVWGYGILGKGPTLDRTTIPEKIPRTLFGYSEFDSDVKVRSVYCGVHGQGAINNRGELFTWGKNRCGFLGLGDRYNDQYFPLKVGIANKVVKVDFGVEHTGATAKAV